MKNYFLANCFPKLHENERNLTKEGASLAPPWIPQCDGLYFDISDECTRQILSRQSIQMSKIELRQLCYIFHFL